MPAKKKRNNHSGDREEGGVIMTRRTHLTKKRKGKGNEGSLKGLYFAIDCNVIMSNCYY